MSGRCSTGGRRRPSRLTTKRPAGPAETARMQSVSCCGGETILDGGISVPRCEIMSRLGPITARSSWNTLEKSDVATSPSAQLPNYIFHMHDSLYFSDHHLQVREMVRDFARSVVRPTARQYDLESRFPWDNIKQMAELGLFGIPWPEELGGSGMDYLSYIIVIHELAKVDASHAITISAHTTLGTSPIVDFGTPEQKKKYVPLLATGKVLGGFGLTEPGAGSDAGGTKTVAVEKGDHYVLNGSKIFITHAGVGEIFVATARTDPSAKKTHGITAFIVTKDTTDLAEATRVGIGHEGSLAKIPGFSAGKKEDKLGWRASDTRELVFQDAIVPKENVLGPVNNGFRQFLHTLDGGRIGIAAPSLGIAEGALEECLAYTSTRKQFGK